MGDVRERLKHGKALCGKVFRNYVETFNWLVDFGSNLKGDGDAGGSGKIFVDRSDANHPIIRFVEKTEMRPWTFGCSEKNGTVIRGWYRQIVQIGLTVHNHPTPDAGFTDETECKDGDHYLKIDFNQQDDSEKVKIVRVAPGAGATFQDIPHGILGVFLGTVENGKQTAGIYWPPVIYHYL